jgi:hypothetical protein
LARVHSIFPWKYNRTKNMTSRARDDDDDFQKFRRNTSETTVLARAIVTRWRPMFKWYMRFLHLPITTKCKQTAAANTI